MTKVHQKCFPTGGLLACPVVGILGSGVRGGQVGYKDLF